MTDWLYPLSSAAGYWFEMADGETQDTGPSSFEQMIQAGGADDDWGAYRNWRNARRGDRVWPYYGTSDGDLGIVGLATIRSIDEPTEPRGRATIWLDWDKKATTRLLLDPYAASAVRESIPHPIAALWRIDPDLGSRLAAHVSKARSRPGPAEVPDYAKGVTSTLQYTRPSEVTVVLRHDALLRPLKTRLETLGWLPIRFDVGAKHVDLAMEKRKSVVLVEAKTVAKSTRQPVRDAFAQLAEYAWRYREAEPDSSRRIVSWALFEKSPTDDEIRFLEAHQVLVTWVRRGGRFQHGPETARHRMVVGV